MDLRFNCSLWISTLIISTTFMACTKDDEPKINEEVEVNNLVYVSEAEQGDYKNAYSYERVDGKIRLKQVDLYQSGVKRYDLKLKYDDQNRLIECKRSVLASDYYYHENKILNDYLPSDYSIQYGNSKLTVIDNDNSGRIRVYSLGDDGFAKAIRWSFEDESHIMSFKRSGNDLVDIDYTLGSGNISTNKKYSLVYDGKRSIDYLRMVLPCLYSNHNILRTVITVDGQEISRISYAYSYSSVNYPVVILKNETIINGNQEELFRTSMNLKYINAENIN